MADFAGKLMFSRIWTQNGPVGTIQDILFEGRQWRIRHLVVGKYRWLPFGKVLVNPTEINRPSPRARIMTGMKREALRQCTPARDHIPSAKRESLAKQRARIGSSRPTGEATSRHPRLPKAHSPKLDTNVHSVRKCFGFSIQATDGYIGLVYDFKVNTASWSLDGIVVNDGRAGINDRDVVPITLVKEISWIRSNMTLTTSKDFVLDAVKHCN